MIASRASAQCAHRPLHRSSETLCRRPSGTQPRPGITSTSSTRSLATNAPGYLDCHTVGGVCAQVHASDPAIRKEAMPPYETHVGGTQHMCLSAAPSGASWCGEAPGPRSELWQASATFSHRAAEGGQPICRTSKVEGRRHRRCRYVSRGDSCEVWLIPIDSSGSLLLQARRSLAGRNPWCTGRELSSE